jgi:hypothetical protein
VTSERTNRYIKPSDPRRKIIPIGVVLIAAVFLGLALWARFGDEPWIEYRARDGSFVAEFPTNPSETKQKFGDAEFKVVVSTWDYACEIHRVTYFDAKEKVDQAKAGAMLAELTTAHDPALEKVSPVTATLVDGIAARRYTARVPHFYKVVTKSRYGEGASYNLTGAMTCLVFTPNNVRFYILELIVPEDHVGEDDGRFIREFRVLKR